MTFLLAKLRVANQVAHLVVAGSLEQDLVGSLSYQLLPMD